MAKIKRRKLPVGVQSFRKIREEGYLYVDKTDIVWELANNGDQYNYLSRPRRFGKSVLVDTLESYFLSSKVSKSWRWKRNGISILLSDLT